MWITPAGSEPGELVGVVEGDPEVDASLQTPRGLTPFPSEKAAMGLRSAALKSETA
jgi:hypothetical protein